MDEMYCERTDCEFESLGEEFVKFYFPPLYGRDGEVMNNDEDITHAAIKCKSCSRHWAITRRDGEIVNAEERT